MKQVSQRGGECTLIVHEFILCIDIAQRLNTMFNLDLASFKFIARTKNLQKGCTFLLQLLTGDKET